MIPGRLIGPVKSGQPCLRMNESHSDLCATQGVLDARGRQVLSRIIFYVFIPSLTFTKLAASVDLHNMSRWWILPVNVLIR